MRIAALFNDDFPRLKFTRRAYEGVLNPEDYYAVFDVFQSFSHAFMLYDFINFQREPAEVIVIEHPPVEVIEEPPCLTTDQEYNSLIATIKREVFPMRRLGLAKSVTKGRCLTVGQIRGVINLLSIGGDRVELAKHTHEFCVNPLEYHQLIDVMTFQSDKDELLSFIQSRQ